VLFVLGLPLNEHAIGVAIW